MSVDTQWFFYVFLAGFMAVKTFRYFSVSKEKYSEFEWFALSAFFGIQVIMLFNMLPEQEEAKKILSNPLGTGAFLSFIAIFSGYGASRVTRTSFFKFVMECLGKDGGRDRSADLRSFFRRLIR
jgi:hypothetical protein